MQQGQKKQRTTESAESAEAGACATLLPLGLVPHPKLISSDGAGSFVVVETVAVDGDEGWSTELPADCPFPSSTAKADQPHQARAAQ